MEILNEKAGRVNNGDDSVKGLLSRCGELFLGGGDAQGNWSIILFTFNEKSKEE